MSSGLYYSLGETPANNRIGGGFLFGRNFFQKSLINSYKTPTFVSRIINQKKTGTMTQQIQNKEQAQTKAVNFLTRHIIESEERFGSKGHNPLSRNGCVSITFHGSIITGSIPAQELGGYVVHYRTHNDEIVPVEANYYPER